MFGLVILMTPVFVARKNKCHGFICWFFSVKVGVLEKTLKFGLLFLCEKIRLYSSRNLLKAESEIIAQGCGRSDPLESR